MNTPKSQRAVRAAAIIVAAIALLMPQAMKAADHEKIFGIQAGWISRNKSAEAGLTFQYGFTQHFRLAAAVDVALKKENRDAMLIDVNGHFPFRTSSRVELYPLAGVNFSAWSEHIEADDPTFDDVTNRTSRFGLNAGGGVGFYVSKTLKLSFEAKYTLVKGYSCGRLTAGIAYVF